MLDISTAMRSSHISGSNFVEAVASIVTSVVDEYRDTTHRGTRLVNCTLKGRRVGDVALDIPIGSCADEPDSRSQSACDGALARFPLWGSVLLVPVLGGNPCDVDESDACALGNEVFDEGGPDSGSPAARRDRQGSDMWRSWSWGTPGIVEYYPSRRVRAAV